MVKGQESSPAPALSRGIAVLRFLADGNFHTLDGISGELDLPKSSVSRLLITLENEGLIERQKRQYRALKQLADLDSDTFDNRVRKAAAQLLEETGHTVEWYEYNESGMKVTFQLRPAGDAATLVKARPGFIRYWYGELDAVNCLGHKAFGIKHDFSSHTTYLADLQYGILDAGLAEKWIYQAARQGYRQDRFLNTFRLRRSAVLLTGEEKAGILAVAELVPEGEDGKSAEILQSLLQARDFVCKS